MNTATKAEALALRSILLAFLLGVAIYPTRVLADPYTDVGFRGWGPRVGLSLNPDQLHFGAHIDFGNFARHVRFQPNLELGFGDDIKLFTANAELAYRFSARWDVWSPYLGGGIGANVKSVDVGGDNTSRTDMGVNLLAGIEKGLSSGDRFFIEAKFSLNDVPDAKGTVGWTFYH